MMYPDRPLTWPKLKHTRQFIRRRREMLLSEEAPGYDPDAYLTQLLALVEEDGVDGGVWILDESANNVPAQDSSGNDYDLPVSGTPNTGGVSFLDDNRTSTSISSSEGYREVTEAPWVQLEGCFGLFYDETVNLGVNIIQLEFSESRWIQLGRPDGASAQIRLKCVGDDVNENFTTENLAPHLWYVNYSLSGDDYEFEVFKDFVSLGARSGTMPLIMPGSIVPNWVRSSGEFRVGLLGGNGGGNAQYVFAMDRQLTPEDIAALQLAYNRNFEDYSP